MFVLIIAEVELAEVLFLSEGIIDILGVTVVHISLT